MDKFNGTKTVNFESTGGFYKYFKINNSQKLFKKFQKIVKKIVKN